MMPDYPLEETLDFKFTSRSFSTGVPTTLAGTPVIEIYEDNSLTQITGAETLTVDFDGVTGLNNLRVVATAANGFDSGKSYAAVISAGTVGGVSVVGEVVAQFSIERSIDVNVTKWLGTAVVATSAGFPDVNTARIANVTTPAFALQRVFHASVFGTCQATGQTSTNIRLAAGESSNPGEYDGWLITIYSGTGNKQGRLILDYDEVNKDCTVSPALSTVLDGTSFYAITPITVGKLATADQSSLNIDAVKAKTDQLAFTVTNQVDANIQSINDAGVVGDGNATPWDGA